MSPIDGDYPLLGDGEGLEGLVPRLGGHQGLEHGLDTPPAAHAADLATEAGAHLLRPHLQTRGHLALGQAKKWKLFQFQLYDIRIYFCIKIQILDMSKITVTFFRHNNFSQSRRQHFS